MIKIILFDVDGVIIPKKRRFSSNFSREFKVPIEKLSQFFENEFQLCLVGKADLKHEIKKYLEEWNWKKSVDELLLYWFNNEKETDKNVLKNVKELKNLGIKCFLSTNNEKYRADYLLKNIGLEQYFNGIFSSSRVGYLKPQQEFWQTIYDELGETDKKSILCIDDDKENIKSAKKFGFQAEFYDDFDNYKNKINDYINKK